MTIDDELYNRALQLAEPGMEKSELYRETFKTYVRIQSAKRLAALGGKLPDYDLYDTDI